MLFNSYIFIFLFLPIVFVGFFSISQLKYSFALFWLVIASLFFYSYWDVNFVLLIIISVMGNYLLSMQIVKADIQNNMQAKKMYFYLSLIANIALLAYYKYFNFFIDNINNLCHTNYNINKIILPLGISFFTFTQIAYLVDAYKGKVKYFYFPHYLLFITYFPHLIAGPILHHKDMMPQFSNINIYHFKYENLGKGITIFIIGLFKKVILADGIAVYVSPIFDAPSLNITLNLFEAWAGALSYALQLYFDFSGYCDMAIGISKMFGIDLPINFNSPYKAVNIIDFWRRWHITLSNFLRDYLYIPLGGNKKGSHNFNLLLTMLLGGLWHGAGWTYIIWGGFHGTLLVLNHALKRNFEKFDLINREYGFIKIKFLNIFLTFILVTIGWVIFRSKDFNTCLSIIKTMLGFNGVQLPLLFGMNLEKFGINIARSNSELISVDMIKYILLLLTIVWCFPNSQQIMEKYYPMVLNDNKIGKTKTMYYSSIILGMVMGAIGFMAVIHLNQKSEFLYFQF